MLEKMDEEERWDKIKSWDNIQLQIQSRLKEPEKYDQSMSLNHGPQLYQTMRHPAHIKCMVHFTSNMGDNFVTHYRIGTVDHISCWTMESHERDAVCKQERFTIYSEIKCLMYIPSNKVYFGFGSDLVMRVYTDARGRCQEVGAIPCDTTILCMSYCKDTNEVFAGGIGTLEKWRVKGSEHSAVARRGEKFNLELKSDEWVIDIKVDPRNKQLLALTYDGIYVANYQTLQQTHHLQNRHEGSLRCCSFYKEREYFITGGGDGLVKVWNAVVFSQVHIFYGHRAPITGLQVHNSDPLLFSSSLDGTVQIWRMDNFCKYMRVDLGDPIHQMKLLGEEEFFCQTEREIKVYNLNQFYHLFAPVESSVFKLQLCPGSNDKPSRIICSTEDGSVRFFSPVTGETITIIYPMPTFQILTNFAYCRGEEKLMTVLQNGDVLVFNCETNPCKAEEIWQANTYDEQVTRMVLVNLMYRDVEDMVVRDTVIFGGLRNGQINLLHATNSVMVKNVQAHEGAVTCMEYATELDSSGFQILETSKTIVTGGDDSFLKIWHIVVIPGHTGDQISLELLLKIHCNSPPQYISIYENTLCLTLTETKHQSSCMQMYRLDSSDPGDPSAQLQYTQLQHPSDEDHQQQITAVDKCPLLGLFATAAVDGYIKVWNRHNQLVREMSFGEPLFGLCFANPRGDLLIGYQNHVCLIPLTSFFPQNYLESVAFQNFKDERKESLLTYNPKIKPWFDPRKLPAFSTSLSVRTQEKNNPEPEDILEDLEALEEERIRKFEQERSIIESEIIKRLEKRRQSRARSLSIYSREETEATSFLGSLSPEKSRPSPPLSVYSPIKTPREEDTATPRPPSEVSPRNTLTPRTQAQLNEILQGDFSETTPDLDAESELDTNTPRIKQKPKKKKKKMVKFEKKEQKGAMNNLHLLTPVERALLKRKPIIALDGYIPNSVIRKQLGFRPPTPPLPQRTKDVWTPKPVPVAKPSHAPGYEEEEAMDMYEIAARYRMYQSDSDEDSIYRWSGSEEEVVERPQHGGRQRRHRRKCKTENNSDESDGWSDGEEDDEEEEDNDDENKARMNDDFEDETGGVEVAESLIGTQFSLLAEGKSLKDQKPFVWGETPEEPARTPVQTFKKVSNMVRTASNLSSTSSKRQFKPQSRRSTPGTPGKYELKSRAFQFGGMELGLGPTPDSLRVMRTKSGGPISREQTKTFNLTNMVVDENSTNVKFKEESKSKRKVPSDMEVIHKLLKDDFFRDVKGPSPSFDSILQRLLTMLDTEDAELHSKACEYILDLHRDVGISDHYLDRIINKLSNQMNNGAGNLNIRKNGLTALSVIGKSRQDVVASILPRLIDNNRDLRDEAAAAIANLTGVTNKDELWNMMEDMGLQKTYNSKEDEDEALKSLAMRLDVPYRSDSFNDWIDGWMSDMQSPIEIEDDLKLTDIEKEWGGREQRWIPESLCISNSTSRASHRLKELSFISDKSRKWTPAEEKGEETIVQKINIKDLEDEQTPRASSKRAKRSRNEGYIPRRVAFRTNIQDAKECTPEAEFDYEDGDRFDPRDPTLYKYYKKRQGMRPGSGMIRGKPTDGKVETGSIQNLRKVSKYTDDLVPVDSGLTSQENLDACSSVIGTDTMSTHDSGIGRDMSISVTSRSDKGWSRSDRSNASSVKFSTHNLGKSSRNLKDWSGTKSRLSPVKSSTSLLQYGGQGLKSLHPDGYNQQTASLSSEWQKFFQTPTALERKRMEMVRKDFNDGKMSHSGPSTIHYINDDIPRLPGEAGLRLLHTVRVGDKTMDGLLERHRVEAIPSKLSSQTKNKQQGQSQFGILKMKWTTDIPIPLRALQPDPSESESIISGSLSTRSQLSQNVPNNTPGLSENRSRRSQKSHDHHKHRSHDQDRKSRMPKDKKSRLPQIVKKYASKESLKMSKSQEADLWTLPSIPGAVDPGLDFVWDHPIPPAPERESRTNIPYIKKDHEHYCKYYNLVKKNLQKYTSSNQTPSLPQIEVTKALPASTAENKKDTLSRGPSLVFPPITLNQLISAK